MSRSITSFFSPKRAAEPSAENPTKKAAKSPEAEDDGLTPEQRKEIEQKRYEAARKLALSKGVPVIGTMGDSWRHVLRNEFKSDYFKKLMQFLEAEASAGKTVFPPPDEVYSWTRACHVRDVKVVILGQDPYHGPGQAHGLCFSVKPGVRPPPSLVNIYKELEEDVDGFKRPDHGYLMSWAEQGVLLLNAVLTVRKKDAASHAQKGWEKFTDAVVDWINKHMSNVVFILWGGYAKKKGKKINKTKHCVLESAHPSPLSVTRFKGCRHFSQANKYLRKMGRGEIDWASVCGPAQKKKDE